MEQVRAVLERLLQELAAESREAAHRECVLEQTQKALADLEGFLVDGEERPPEAVAALREATKALQAVRLALAGPWSKTLGRWAEALQDLKREIDRVDTLATLGELSASVAHEIRNPLCGILLCAEVLRTKLDPADSRAAMLDNLYREAQRMEKVVNNLLHFARQYQPRLIPCSLEEVVLKSIESVRSELVKKQMQVRIQRSAIACEAHVDPDLVQQVFRNILLNSVDACPRGGSVEVDLRAAPDGEGVAVVFRDTGEGIAPEALPRVFDPFFTSKPHGIGLGLSVSKKIVDAHNGRIEVASQKGRGATFTVVFPRRSAEPHRRAAA